VLDRTGLAALLYVSLAAAFQEAPPREWNQSHGNASNTSFVDVAPLKSPPTERWRIQSEQILAGPVVGQQKLFVVVQQSGKPRLLALDPPSGTQLGAIDLALDGELVGLATNEGVAIVVESEGVHAFRLSGSKLALDKSVKGGFGGEPAFVGTTPLVTKSGGAGLQTIDWSSGKVAPLAPKGFGKPGLCFDDKVGGKAARTLGLLGLDEKADKLLLQRLPVTSGGSGAAPLKLGPAEVLWSGPSFAKPDRAPYSLLIPVPGRDGAEWLIWMDDRRGGGFLRKDGFKPLKLAHAPAVSKSKLYGFGSSGALLAIDATDDAEATIAEKSELRAGARQGAASIARDTLLLGNWALELGSKRVLWCLDSIEADGPAIPIGDELIAIKTKDGKLVGFGNGALAKGGASGASGAGGAAAGGAGASGGAPIASSATSSAAPISADLPGSKPGIVRADGLFVAGKATPLDGGRFKLEPESGAPQELAELDVALIDDGKNAKRIGDEQPLYQAFWGNLAAKHALALVPVFEKWRDAKLPDECRRILDEARRCGLPAAKADELLASLAAAGSGKGSVQKKQCVELENDVREASSKAILKAARWCAAHDSKTAATVLLARAIEASPAEPPDPLIAQEWLPAEFPHADTLEATIKSWMEWAAALLPSGATFATPDDSLKRRISITKLGADALFLQTRNILLISKEKDRALLGILLKRGEAAIRALQKLLGPSPDGLVARPLEVRLYVSRKEYLSDFIGGSTPPEWSAGFFSPGDGISRFFSESGGAKDDPMQHDLQETFAHELTHHYTDRRWMHERRGKDAGSYWMVEGFAEFVGSQALEIGRMGDTLDDPTVRAMDMAAAAARAGKLLGFEYLLGLNSPRFHAELEGDAFSARLKHTFTDVYMDKRAVFYMQSTALSFFVINRCKDGRNVYRNWLQQVYGGKTLVDPWKDAGFENAGAMDKAFREFLASI
jgi:hypothetical protein